MNILMSFILYNPLESFLLLLPVWYFNKDKMLFLDKGRKRFLYFLKDIYMISSILLFLQLPLNLLYDSVLYAVYDFCIVTCGAIFIICKYGKVRYGKTQFNLCLLSVGIHVVSLNIIVANEFFCSLLGEMSNRMIQELIGNIYIKVIQFITLILVLGGYAMLKKVLLKTAKNSVKGEIAATIHGWGEPKLSEKLKKEIKDSEK